MHLPWSGSERGTAGTRPSRSEVRRLILMTVVSLIVIAFIVRWILRQNTGTPLGVTPVGVIGDPEEAGRAPEGLPDGTGIVLPQAEDPEALAGVVDETDLEVTDPAFLYLIKSVGAQPSETIRSRVDPDVKAEDLLLRPAEYRGRYVEVVGTLDHLEPLWLPLENPSGVGQVWWATLKDRNRRLIQVIVLEKDDDLRVGYDTVKVDGPFFKMRSYVMMTGQKGRFPVVIGRGMRYVHEPTYEDTFPSQLGVAVALIVIVVLGVIILAALRSSRRDADVDRIRRSRRKPPGGPAGAPGDVSDRSPPADPGDPPPS